VQSLEELLKLQCGVLSSRQARGHMTKGRLHWLTSRGQWQRPLPQVIVTHNGQLTDEQKRWSAWLFGGIRCAIANQTSAADDGLVGYHDDRVHIMVPYGRAVRSTSFVRVHETRRPPDEEDDVHPLHTPPRLRLPRALIEIARKARSPDDARGPLAAAVQQNLVRPSDVREALVRLGPVPRQAKLFAALDDIECAAHSLLELRFVDLVRRHRLPMPQLQCRVETHGVRYLDATWPAYSVWVEIDGAAHRDDANWIADLDRHNEVSVTGRLTANLRFSGHMLRARPDRCARQLTAALVRGGWSA
jgi:hypothetical protein